MKIWERDEGRAENLVGQIAVSWSESSLAASINLSPVSAVPISRGRTHSENDDVQPVDQRTNCASKRPSCVGQTDVGYWIKHRTERAGEGSLYEETGMVHRPQAVQHEVTNGERWKYAVCHSNWRTSYDFTHWDYYQAVLAWALNRQSSVFILSFCRTLRPFVTTVNSGKWLTWSSCRLGWRVRPKESCIRWTCTLAPPGKCGWTIVCGG